MAGPGPVLKESHRLRRHIHELESRIASSPKQLAAQNAKLQQAEEILKAAQEEIKHLKVKIHDREVSIKTSFQQIDKFEKQREKVEGVKENNALDAEIANAKQRIATFEEEILETMGLVEEKTAQLPTVEKATQAVRNQVAEFKKDYQARLDQFAQERDKTLAELAEVDKGIPPEIREMFDKMVKFKGVEAMSAVEGRTCLACRTDVTAQMQNELLRGTFAVCRSCGRILYV
jgi:uncharacterized protein